MNDPQIINNVVAKQEAYIQLVMRAMSAAKPADLQFIMINETMQLAPYRQAAFFDVSNPNKPLLATASGLVSITESSPYSVWLNRFIKTLPVSEQHHLVSLENVPETFKEDWQEWLPEHIIVFPLKKNHQLLGINLFAREEAWREEEINQLDYLHQTYSYCMAALQKNHTSWSKFFAKIFSLKSILIASLLFSMLMFIPVRLSTLAPAEVIALNAFSVAAPQDGVIHAFTVSPNSAVKLGDVLFTLDDTGLLNRYEVASKALATAKADALVAEQRAFDDVRGKAELAGAMGRMREKEAELNAVQTLMARVEIKAERDGIAVFSDANDWVGRPVQTGERIMQIANPQDAGLLMWLPVKDALNLEKGAPMKLFLHTDPLHPITANLLQTSYQATLSPDNVSSYRIKGKFDLQNSSTEQQNLPRIGLRGTARISGQWTVLGYYLFRRPIAATREWLGV
jgi:Biotin-lipoyl like/HlyD family secretion protein